MVKVGMVTFIYHKMIGGTFWKNVKEMVMNKITAAQFKASAHSIGEIMGVQKLGKTGESYCKEWYLKKQFNRKPDFYNRYVEKGLKVEHLGIKHLSATLNRELVKNDEYFSNEFVHGCPDVIDGEIIYDLKSSWNLFSFPYFDTVIPNRDYYLQLQAYMWLTGLRKAALVYCLIDTPQPLIDQELKKLYYASGGVAQDWTPETYEHLYVNYRFDDIPQEKRIKRFDVKYDEKCIELMEARVKGCRTYLETVI